MDVAVLSLVMLLCIVLGGIFFLSDTTGFTFVTLFWFVSCFCCCGSAKILVEDDTLSAGVGNGLGSGFSFSFLEPRLKKFRLGGKMGVPKVKKVKITN